MLSPNESNKSNYSIFTFNDIALPGAKSIYESSFGDIQKSVLTFHEQQKDKERQQNNYDPLLNNQDPYSSRGGLTRSRESLDRQSYVGQSDKSAFLNNDIDYEREAGKLLARNAFTAFNSDYYRLTNQGVNTIKRITGDFDLTRTFTELEDNRKEDYDRWSSSIAYNYLYAHDTHNDGLYGGLALFKNKTESDSIFYRDGQEQEINFGRQTLQSVFLGEVRSATANVSLIHDEFIRSDREILLSKMSGDYMTVHHAVKSVSERLLRESSSIAKPGIATAIALIESSSNELNIDLFQLQNKAISDVLIDKIRREAGRIAKGEFKVNINLAGPSNQSQRTNQVGLQILGPNILVMERLYQLQQLILQKAEENETSDGISLSEPEFTASMLQRFQATTNFSNIDSSNLAKYNSQNEKVKNVLDNFRIRLVEGSYHPKVYSNEKFAIIGSFNWTSPVGSNPNMAGSNYEEVYIFRNREGSNLQQINKDLNEALNPNRGVFDNLPFNRNNTGINENTDLDKLDALISNHLYHQTRLLQQGDESRPNQIVSGSAMYRNIGKGRDAYNNLTTLIDYTKNTKDNTASTKRELYLVLNQVWLLNYGDEIYGTTGGLSGEFGPSGLKNRSTSHYDIGNGLNGSQNYRKTQDDLFDLIINDKAYIAVDINNYRSNVVSPMYQSVYRMLGLKDNANLSEEEAIKRGKSILERDYDGKLSELVRRVKTNVINSSGSASLDQIQESLKKELGLDIDPSRLFSAEHLDKIDGANDAYFRRASTRTVKQLLAIVSGNILQSTEPMQHTKSHFAIETNLNTGVFTVMGFSNSSSNTAMESANLLNGEDDYSGSVEAGVFAVRSNVSRMQSEQAKYAKQRDEGYALPSDAEDRFIDTSSPFMVGGFKKLTGHTVGAVKDTDSTVASWQSKVSIKGTNSLLDRITNLNKELGFDAISSSYNFDNYGNITSINLNVNIANIAGTMGMGDLPSKKFRVSVLRGMGKNSEDIVYFIDQNKLITNSLFVNKTGEEINTAYGRVEAGDSLKLSSLDTTLSMLSSLAAEGAYRALVSEPNKIFKDLDKKYSTYGTTLLVDNAVRYLEKLSIGSNRTSEGYGDEFLKSINASQAVELSDIFSSFHINSKKNDTRNRALDLTIRNEQEETKRIEESKNLVGHLALLGSYNSQIEALSKDRIKTTNLRLNNLIKARDTVLSNIYSSLEFLVSSTEYGEMLGADLAPGMMEVRNNRNINHSIKNIFKEITKSLFEPFITQAQASTYGSSQLTARTPLFGIRESQKKFRDTLQTSSNQNKDSLKKVFKYALSQPAVFGPTDDFGSDTDNYVRSVAEGNSVSESIDDTGYSMYGLKRTPIGDISNSYIATRTAVGGVETKEEFIRKITTTYKQIYGEEIPVEELNKLVNSTNFKDHDKLNFYNFGLEKKLSQISQRLKNVLGSRPMRTIDIEFSSLVNDPKKRVLASSYIEDRLTLRRLELIERQIGFISSTLSNSNSNSANLNRILEFMKTDKQSILNSNLYEGLDRALMKGSLDLDISQDDIAELKRTFSSLIDRAKTAVSDDFRYAIPISSDFRAVLNEEMDKQVQDYKASLKEEFGFKDEDFYHKEGEEEISLARFMLLSSIRIADSMATGAKGFTGANKTYSEVNNLNEGRKFYKRDQYILVQLSGLYSDYGYGNPVYGGDPATVRKYIREGYKALTPEEKTKIALSNGFLEKREIRHKSSQLQADYFRDGQLLGRKGDITSYDPENNRVIVVEAKADGNLVPTYELNILNQQHIDELRKASLGDDLENRPLSTRHIDARDMTGFLQKVIDNFKPLDNLPATANLERQSWHRIAENSHEILLSSSQLPANKDNNQIIFEMVYLRMLEPSGGTRIEASGGLAKSVMANTGYDRIYQLERLNTFYGEKKVTQALNNLIGEPTGSQALNNLIGEPTGSQDLITEGKVDYFTYILLQHNLQQASYAKNSNGLRLEQVFGHLSKSNLKSYFYSHGSTVLRDRNRMTDLTHYYGLVDGDKNSADIVKANKKLAASLLLSFGEDYFTESDGASLKRSLGIELYKQSIDNQGLGSWYQDLTRQMTLEVLTNNKKIETSKGEDGYFSDLVKGKAPEETSVLVKALMSGETISDSANQTLIDDIRATIGLSLTDKIRKSFAGSSHSIAAPGVMLIKQSDLLKALRGEDRDGVLANIVDKQLDRASYENKDYIVLEKDRNAVLLAAALDTTAQLINQTQLIDIPIDINLNDTRVLGSLASIMSYSKLELLNSYIVKKQKEGINAGSTSSITEEENQAFIEIQAIIKAQASRVPMIQLATDLSYSSAKIPIGTQNQGRVELQHLIRPLVQNIGTFRDKTSQLSSLRKLVANSLAGLSAWETATGIEKDLVDIGSNSFNIGNNSLSAINLRRKFLSFYSSMKLDEGDPLAETKKNLNIYFKGLKNEDGSFSGGGIEDISNNILDKLSKAQTSEEKVKLYRDFMFLNQTMPERMTVGVADEFNPSTRLAEIITEYSIDSDKASPIIEAMKGISMQNLMDSARLFHLDSDKSFGITLVNTIVPNFSHEAMGFFIPNLTVKGATEDGLTQFEIDNENVIPAYLMSGKHLEAIGMQNQSFIDPLVQHTLTLLSGFAPGTEMSALFEKIALMQRNGLSIVNLSNREYQLYKSYSENAVDMLAKLAEEGSSSRIQQAFGAKQTLPGVVSSTIGSFLVPEGFSIIPQESMRVYGTSLREENLRSVEINRVLEKLIVLRKDKAQKSLITYYESYLDALSNGISEEGIRNLNTPLKTFTFEDETSLSKGLEYAQSLQQSYKASKAAGKDGDAFVFLHKLQSFLNSNLEIKEQFEKVNDSKISNIKTYIQELDTEEAKTRFAQSVTNEFSKFFESQLGGSYEELASDRFLLNIKLKYHKKLREGLSGKEKELFQEYDSLASKSNYFVSMQIGNEGDIETLRNPRSIAFKNLKNKYVKDLMNELDSLQEEESETKFLLINKEDLDRALNEKINEIDNTLKIKINRNSSLTNAIKTTESTEKNLENIVKDKLFNLVKGILTTEPDAYINKFKILEKESKQSDLNTVLENLKSKTIVGFSSFSDSFNRLNNYLFGDADERDIFPGLDQRNDSRLIDALGKKKGRISYELESIRNKGAAFSSYSNIQTELSSAFALVLRTQLQEVRVFTDLVKARVESQINSRNNSLINEEEKERLTEKVTKDLFRDIAKLFITFDLDYLNSEEDAKFLNSQMSYDLFNRIINPYLVTTQEESVISYKYKDRNTLETKTRRAFLPIVIEQEGEEYAFEKNDESKEVKYRYSDNELENRIDRYLESDPFDLRKKSSYFTAEAFNIQRILDQFLDVNSDSPIYSFIKFENKSIYEELVKKIDSEKRQFKSNNESGEYKLSFEDLTEYISEIVNKKVNDKYDYFQRIKEFTIQESELIKIENERIEIRKKLEQGNYTEVSMTTASFLEGKWKGKLKTTFDTSNHIPAQKYILNEDGAEVKYFRPDQDNISIEINSQLSALNSYLADIKTNNFNERVNALGDKDLTNLVNASTSNLETLQKLLSSIDRVRKNNYENSSSDENSIFSREEDIETLQDKLFGKESTLDLSKVLGEKGIYSDIENITIPGEQESTRLAKNYDYTLDKITSLLYRQAMNMYDDSSTLQTLTFRSPPFGGTEQQRQVLQNLGSLVALNNLAQARTEDGTPTLNFNIERNRSLALISPLSFLTMNLGDFDGDPYTNIYSKIKTLYDEIGAKDSAIQRVEAEYFIKVSSLNQFEESKKRSQESSLTSEEQDNRNLQDNDSILSNLDSSSYASDLAKLTRTYEETVANLNREKSVLETQIKVYNAELNSNDYTLAVKKEIANYIGVDKRHFLSKEEGGFRDTSLDLGIAYTYIQQGKELFGGIENIAGKIEPLKEVFQDLFGDNSNLESANNTNTQNSSFNILEALLRLNVEENNDKTEIRNFLNERLNYLNQEKTENNRNSMFYLLLGDDEINNNFIDFVSSELKNIGLTSNDNNQANEENKDLIWARLASQFASRKEGLETLQGILGQGAGVSIDSGSFGAMVKVLGQAGGDVLGKTYNTIVTTQFADSPLLALSHVLDQDGVIDSINKFSSERDFGSEIGSSIAGILAGGKKAESLQGFMKSINQLLRDGIKPKGGGSLTSDLSQLSQDYENINSNDSLSPEDKEAEKSRVVTKMASHFGPSGSAVGMNALMELNTLISNKFSFQNTQFVDQAGFSFDSNPLFKQLGLRNVEGHALLKELSDTDSPSEGLISNHSEEQSRARAISYFDVAALKVTRDLQTLVVGYRYNTAVGGEGMNRIGKNALADSMFNNRLNSIENKNSIERKNLILGDSFTGEVTIQGIDTGIQNLFKNNSQYKDILHRYLGDDEKFESFVNNDSYAKERYMMFELINQTVEATSDFLGDKGENLFRFVNTQSLRMGVSTVASGRGNSSNIEALLADKFTEGDVLQTFLNLAATGKLNPESSMMFYDIIKNHEQAKKEGKDGKDVNGTGGTEENGKKGASTDSEIEILKEILSRTIGVQDDTNISSGSGNEAFQRLLESTDPFSFFDTDNKEKKKEIVYKNFATFLDERMQASSTTNRSAVVSELIINQEENKGTELKNFVSTVSMQGRTYNELSALEQAEVDRLAIHVKEANLQENLKNNLDIGKLITPDSKSSNLIDVDVTQRYIQDRMNKATKSAQKVGDMSDMLLPSILTLAGAAIYGGRLDSDVIGDVAGSTLMASIYMRQNMKKEALMNIEEKETGTSGSWKSHTLNALRGLGGQTMIFNMSLQENEGDVVKSFVSQTAMNAGFAFGSRVLAPFIEEKAVGLLFNQAINMSQNKALYESMELKEHLSARQQRELMMRANGVLDEDDFMKTRSLGNALNSTILSGVLGLVMANTSKSVAMDLYEDPTELSLIDGLINSLNNAKQSFSNRQDEREDFLYLESMEGELVDYEEQEPIEAMQNSSIRLEYSSPQEIEFESGQAYQFLNAPSDYEDGEGQSEITY